MNRNKPNWEHLNEELHVLITCEDTEGRAQVKLNKAKEEVKKLLVPTVCVASILTVIESRKHYEEIHVLH